MSSYQAIAKDGLWTKNPALVQLLGLCPLLAVTGSVVNALGLGLAGDVPGSPVDGHACSGLRPRAITGAGGTAAEHVEKHQRARRENLRRERRPGSAHLIRRRTATAARYRREYSGSTPFFRTLISRASAVHDAKKNAESQPTPDRIRHSAQARIILEVCCAFSLSPAAALSPRAPPA